MLCNRFGPLEQSNFSFEVRRSVNLVWNATPIAITIIFTRPPTRRIPLSDDTVDSIRRKKTVFDSLPQAVLVNGIPEVKVCVTGFVAQRRGGHAKLIGRLKVFKNSTPARFFPCTDSMISIHDHQIQASDQRTRG